MSERGIGRREFAQRLGVTALVAGLPGAARRWPIEGLPAADPWDLVPEILRRIRPPTFPARDFEITRYGAVADGEADCTAAFRGAIEACARAGGGRVVVPDGRFLTGPIHLRSRVNLHVSDGATIAFHRDPARYLPAVFTRWEGVELFNYSPLIYAFDCDGIAVTGRGTLDGQADNEHWWPWNGKREYGWTDGGLHQKRARDRLFTLAEQGRPVAERRFGQDDGLRPSFLQPYRSRNVLIEGITIRNSPMWEIHPVLCRNVTVRGVSIDTHGPNNDGCNPESCRDVLIEDCDFDTGDDCIAIKSGRNADGRRLKTPSAFIVVRNCRMKDGHGGVTIGSEISGGVHHVFAERCTMDSPRLDRAIRLKTNAMRGGVLEHIYVRDITVGEVAEAVLHVDFLYEEGRNGSFLPVVRDIELRDVTSRKSAYGLYLRGFERSPISRVRLTRCSFDGVAKGNLLEHVRDLETTEVRINGQPLAAAGASATRAWSVRMAESVMRRHPEIHQRWDYTAGVMLLALRDVGLRTGDPRLAAYVKRNMDRSVQPDGSILTYKLEDFNLDQINQGKLLFPLLAETKDERYRRAAMLLREQLRRHPRTSEGGFWHKQIYPHQMWLDGLYMAAPFYAQFGAVFGEPAAFDDVTRQIKLVWRHTRDEKSGLLYHGWDESRSQPWADRTTGRSANFWGRAMGWYAMALVDVLDVLPNQHRDRAEVVGILRDLAEAVARVQDSPSGLWYQVLDQAGRKGNYLEASASSMFVYALAKGASKGYLEPRYRRVAERAFDGLIGRLVSTDVEGLVSLGGICQVAGLGGPRQRDGSFAYYVSEPVVANDHKGVGPFILAALELGR